MASDLKKARILICNDDGIDAMGIKVLEKVARNLCDDVWVVAPLEEQSGTAHSFTARGSLSAKNLGSQRYSVSGKPTDCLLYAFNVLLKDKRPDFVFSGVNHGGNLGRDVLYSGTTGVAIEGTLQGAKSFAFSLCGAKEGSPYWPMVEAFLPKVLERYAFSSWEEETFYNVNFPDFFKEEIKGLQEVPLSHRKIGDKIDIVHQTKDECVFDIGYERIGEILPQTDAYAVQEGFISVTPVCLNLNVRAL